MTDPNPEDQGEPGDTRGVDYAPTSARQTIAELRDLNALAGRQGPRPGDDRLEELGLVLEGDDPLEDQAGRLLDAMPTSIDVVTRFEVALDQEGPERRLCFECLRRPPAGGSGHRYLVIRAYFRYTWISSVTCPLSGEDAEVAVRFARRVVPELFAGVA